jgi:hypothetical protein
MERPHDNRVRGTTRLMTRQPPGLPNIGKNGNKVSQRMHRESFAIRKRRAGVKALGKFKLDEYVDSIHTSYL